MNLNPNGVSFSPFPPNGSVHFLTTSNDCQARDFDIDTFTVCNSLSFPWIANVTLRFIF
jgi:hypothetical protein